MISNTVEEFLKKYKLLDKTLIVAFSGGYDSMCLLHILQNLSSKHPFKLIAIHLNHNWRGKESDNEEANCRQFCNNIEFYCEKIDNNIPQTETAARDARYAFYEKYTKLCNADAVITAHNANDNAETIFYRLLKGTGITGLEGIQEKRDIYYRPLLSVYRKDIENYCKEQKLTPNNDSSNLNTKYSRNRIRQEIFPQLLEISPDFIKNLNNLSNSAREANKIIEKNIQRLEEYSPATFAKLSNDLQNAIVHKFLRQKKLDYDRKRIEELVSFIINNKQSKSGKTLSLTTDKWLFVNSQEIKVVKNKIKNVSQIKINKIGQYKFENHIIEIEETKEIPEHYPSDKEYTAYIQVNTVDFTLRHRMDGDIIQPLGMKGSQKFKKYLNEKKIPKHEKDDLILLTYNNEILWIAGIGISDKIKVINKPTHIIRVKRGTENE